LSSICIVGNQAIGLGQIWQHQPEIGLRRQPAEFPSIGCLKVLRRQIGLKPDPVALFQTLEEGLPLLGRDQNGGRFFRIVLRQDLLLLIACVSWVSSQWRSHAAMQEWAASASITREPLDPDPVIIDGQFFDPAHHFTDWREKQANWSAGKPERAGIARRRIVELAAQGESNPVIAARLNAENIRSLSGNLWTSEMVRKLPGKA
jgi:hypothetical protein